MSHREDDAGWVVDYGQFDRACDFCPDPSDCDMAGYCQLGDLPRDEWDDDADTPAFTASQETDDG